MKLFYCLLLLSFPLFLKAQSFAIRHDRLNIAYVGIDNPITIVSGNCTCDKLTATVDQGTLIKSNGCNFIYKGEKAGHAIITISQTTATGTKVVGKQELRVKEITGFYFSVGFQRTGYYPLQQFKAQSGLMINTDGPVPDRTTFRVVSFRLITIRKDGVETIGNEGPYFNANSKAAIARLHPGDRVLIENVKVEGPDYAVRSMNSLTYTMK